MYLKICEFCGKEFETKYKKKKCCSRSCSSKLGMKKFNDDESKFYVKICKVCGQEYKAKNHRSEFCSNKCSSKYFDGKYTKEWILSCLYCGKEIIRYSKDKPKENVFCDQSCSGKYKNKIGTGKERECKQCGRVFQTKHGRHYFCLNECKKIYNYEHQDKVTVRCSNCEKDVERYKSNAKKGKNFFCCKQCEAEYRIEQSKDIRVCENCGKEFVCKKGEKLRFCSISCQSEWQSYTRCGKNSPTYNHEITEDMRVKKCEYCGKDMIGTPKSFEIKKFCSRVCMMNAMNNTMTKPHRIVTSILDALGVYNITELHVGGGYHLDTYLPEFCLGIEIMGLFWHCDVRNYSEPKDEIQNNGIRRDKNKKVKLSNLKIPTLYIWENDAYFDEKVCVELIMEFIKRNGTLDNYHSMNYSLCNDKLSLNKELLTPHFEK